MNFGKVELVSIKLTKYDRMTDYFEYELNCNVGETPKVFSRKGSVKRMDVAVADILNELKNMNKQKVEVWDNSTLDTFSRVDIEDEENVEKKLVYFFRRINDKISEFKHNKSAAGYLDRYNSIAGFSMKL
ncbi:hypothetical protein J4413_00580 [Candidatus Woesearchaeota archaeon]|nr:hypothetical protein [Candidatus Woesearchaeota archaeon]